MKAAERFDQYVEHLSEGLGHADRHAGLRGYCTGLMLPLSRKSVEPMAARLDPLHASARHQALHHFVAQAQWSESELLRRVAQWVVPKMDFSGGGWWIIDDTGFPKKGRHSVGVARQYCGMLGKQDNCQVAVSVSLASDGGSLPVAWQLYLPEEWATDVDRRAKAGVSEALRFATKPQIALAQLRQLLAEGAPRHCVLADAGYGVDNAFRQALSDLGLLYAVGVTSAVVVWPPGVEPLAPAPYSGRGRPPVVPVRTDVLQPMSVKALALSLPAQAFKTLSWRDGTNAPLTGRFAAVRVRHAGGNVGKARLRPEQWLLIEWPPTEDEPSKYFLATLPEETPINELVRVSHQRWRIERGLSGLEAGLRPGSLRGPRLAGVPPSRRLEHRGLRLPNGRAACSRATQRRKKKRHHMPAACRFQRLRPARQFLRAQRHVATSITTLRQRLSYQLIERLGQCPCCGRTSSKLLL